MGKVIIEIKNWEKFNPRRDQKNYTWLRLQNDIGTDEKLFGLAPEEKFIWILLLCHASRKNAGSFDLNLDWFANNNGLKIKTVEKTIEFLHDAGIIESHVQSLHASVQSQHTRVQSSPATNDTNDTNERTILPDSPEGEPRRKFDFEPLYQKYPRKEGKQRGMLVCKAQIRTEAEFDLLSRAIDRYTAHCSKTALEPRFIKHFSTFMAGWRDWLDPQTGSVAAAPRASPTEFQGKTSTLPDLPPENPEAQKLAKKYASDIREKMKKVGRLPYDKNERIEDE